jgi:hypothetical protein
VAAAFRSDEEEVRSESTKPHRLPRCCGARAEPLASRGCSFFPFHQDTRSPAIRYVCAGRMECAAAPCRVAKAPAHGRRQRKFRTEGLPAICEQTLPGRASTPSSSSGGSVLLRFALFAWRGRLRRASCGSALLRSRGNQRIASHRSEMPRTREQRRLVDQRPRSDSEG